MHSTTAKQLGFDQAVLLQMVASSPFCSSPRTRGLSTGVRNMPAKLIWAFHKSSPGWRDDFSVLIFCPRSRRAVHQRYSAVPHVPRQRGRNNSKLGYFLKRTELNFAHVKSLYIFKTSSTSIKPHCLKTTVDKTSFDKELLHMQWKFDITRRQAKIPC